LTSAAAGIIMATRRKETTVRKFLLLLGIVGLVIGVLLYLRGRQGDLELEY
jgi:hypothetical protein